MIGSKPSEKCPASLNLPDDHRIGRPLRLSRRNFIAACGSVAISAGAWRGGRSAHAAEEVSSEELQVTGALPDRYLGPEDAPVTIIEYASMTCGHCANFHSKTFPLVKSDYIDQGKVRFILREFPLDPLATAAFMLARCVAGDAERLQGQDGNSETEINGANERYFTFVDGLFENQESWVGTDKPLPALKSIAKQAGLSTEQFEECLRNQKLLDSINWVKSRASDQFQVSSTPTFFIDGELVKGAVPPEEFAELINSKLDH